MTEPEKPLPSLESLQSKIDVAKHHAQKEPSPFAEDDSDGAIGNAMQLGVELFAGVAVGSAVGYFLDRWFGSFPWCFIIFFFLGAAGGFRNLLRAANKK